MLGNIVAVGASAVAAVIDAYTGEIPEWLTVPLILTGLAYAAVTGTFTVSLAAVAGTLAVGYLLYYSGELGGGDVLLLAGISAWKPLVSVAGAQIPSALAVLVLGLLLSSVFYSVYYLLQLGEGRPLLRALVFPYAFLPPAVALVYGAVLTSFLGQRYREELFVRERKVEELVPEDILAEPVDGLPPGKKVLEKGDIEALKKAGVQKVKILDNLPRFGPFILAALLVLLYAECCPLYFHHYAAPLFPLDAGAHP
ncbi:MAG TPA: prepilin peptidase [Euryarchaeota archaeon]|nr:prepilin peptidase [Euryarchaeota archaeon]